MGVEKKNLCVYCGYDGEYLIARIRELEEEVQRWKDEHSIATADFFAAELRIKELEAAVKWALGSLAVSHVTTRWHDELRRRAGVKG